MSNSQLAPIVLFVYNRPEHTAKTLEALRKNTLANESELFIISDGPQTLINEKDQADLDKKIEETRTIVQNSSGFKNTLVVSHKQNNGLAKSIIQGVTEIINKYGKIIVLEDDIITSPSFLKYMNDALDFYQNQEEIFSISGYIFPYQTINTYEYDTFIYPRNSTWGWGTWKNRWEKADWNVKSFSNFSSDKLAQKRFNRGGSDLTKMLSKQMNGQINSWGIRWCYTQFENNAYTVFPIKSFVQNIGFDGSGVHCNVSDKNDVQLNYFQQEFNFLPTLTENKQLIKNVSKFFNKKLSDIISLTNLRQLIKK